LAVQESGEHDFKQVSIQIRKHRKLRHLTLQTLSEQAGLSKSLLSKIENFKIIPSLPVLAKIAQSLKVDVAEFLKGIAGEETGYKVMRAVARSKAEVLDEAKGFLYQSVMGCKLQDEIVFDVQVLTINHDSKRKQLTTIGDEFIFILKGDVSYQLGDDIIDLTTGDAVLFDGAIPHVPFVKGDNQAELLAIYILRESK